MRWVLETDEPPSWGVHRGKGEGRRSRVSHPSEAQPRFKIREPRTERRANLVEPDRGGPQTPHLAADAVEAGGQHVDQEPGDELVRVVSEEV